MYNDWASIVCAAKIEEVMVDHPVNRPPDGDVVVFVSQIVEMTVIDSDRMRSAFQLNHSVGIDDLPLPRSKSDSAQAVGFAGRSCQIKEGLIPIHSGIGQDDRPIIRRLMHRVSRRLTYHCDAFRNSDRRCPEECSRWQSDRVAV